MTVYTHGHHESVLRSHRWRTLDNSAAYLLPNLSPEHTVLDVGCGPGTITAGFARQVAQVTALEVTAQALDLPDNGFDVVHEHLVLRHAGGPGALGWHVGRPDHAAAVVRNGHSA